METFEIVAKKNKKRLTKRIVLWSIAVVLVLAAMCIGAMMLLSKMADNNRFKLQTYYNDRFSIAYPNITYTSAIIRPTGRFSSIMHMDRAKNLDGILVPYDDSNPSLGPTFISLDNTADGVTWFKAEKGINKGAYSRSQFIKSPLFFNTKAEAQDGNEKPVNELSMINQMEGQLVEVALTFDKPYTYDELQKMLPKNLKANWYWLGTQSTYNTVELPVNDLFGMEINDDYAEGSFDSFKDALARDLNSHFAHTKYGNEMTAYDTLDDLEYFQKNFTDLKSAKFAGVILTGKAENFAQLENQDWIYASSIGASTLNQPYYQLDKE